MFNLILIKNNIIPFQKNSKDRRYSERYAAGKEIKLYSRNDGYFGT